MARGVTKNSWGIALLDKTMMYKGFNEQSNPLGLGI